MNSRSGVLEILSQLDGNDDPNHDRLKQYKVLELKKEKSMAFSSNEEFLQASNIKVTIKHDCETKTERLLDLINRSNQLNYTKVRLTEEELKSILDNSSLNNGYVEVEDNFGEYGIVGFFSIDNGTAKHFLFSCRTIGMGIEQYVYASLGYPELDVVGEVRTELSKTGMPNWINKKSGTVPNTFDVQKVKGKLNILVSGGCDLEMLAAYLKPEGAAIDYKFNVGIVRHDNTFYEVGIKKYSDEVKEELVQKIPFIKKDTFDPCLYNSKYDIVVLSVLMDYTQGVYRDGEIAVTIGDFNKPISKEYIPDYFSKIQSDYFLKRFVFTGKIGEEEFRQNLEFIRSNLSKQTKLIIINGCEIPIEHELEVNRYQIHAAYNQVVDRFVQSHENTYLLDMREIVTLREQLIDNIRHYDRKVYFQMAGKLASLINGIYEEANLSSKDSGMLRWKAKRRFNKITGRLFG